MTLGEVLALLDQVDVACSAFATSNPGRYAQYVSQGATHREVVTALYTEIPYTGNLVSPSGDPVA